MPIVPDKSASTIQDDSDFVPSISGLPGGRSLGALRAQSAADDKLNIAWRYQGLSQFKTTLSSAPAVSGSVTYCHTFDLSKKIQESALRNAQICIIDSSVLAHSKEEGYYKDLLVQLCAMVELPQYS
jgi:hypothetical protein